MIIVSFIENKVVIVIFSINKKEELEILGYYIFRIIWILYI